MPADGALTVFPAPELNRFVQARVASGRREPPRGGHGGAGPAHGGAGGRGGDGGGGDRGLGRGVAGEGPHPSISAVWKQPRLGSRNAFGRRRPCGGSRAERLASAPLPAPRAAPKDGWLGAGRIAADGPGRHRPRLAFVRPTGRFDRAPRGAERAARRLDRDRPGWKHPGRESPVQQHLDAVPPDHRQAETGLERGRPGDQPRSTSFSSFSIVRCVWIAAFASVAMRAVSSASMAAVSWPLPVV